MKLLKKGRKKKGMAFPFLIALIVAVTVLVLMTLGYSILRAKGIGIWDFVRNLLRFRIG